MKWRKSKHDKSNQLAGNEPHQKRFSANAHSEKSRNNDAGIPSRKSG